MPHYRMRLPPSKAEADQRRSAKTMSKIRGRERALGREVGGEVRTVEIRRPADWQPYQARIEKMMNASWQARLLGHRFRMDDLRAVADRGWVRSYLLLAGEEAVAFAQCYQGQQAMIYEIIGYDQRYARYSPGISLLYRMLDGLYADNPPRYLDFGEGEADYKEHLANDVISENAVLVVRRGPGLGMLFGLSRACAVLDRVGRAMARRLGLRRRLARI
jgi:hypothetical protein